MLSRRQFVRSAIIAGAGLTAGNTLINMTGCSSQNLIRNCEFLPRVFADLHCHPLIDAWNGMSPIAQGSPFLFNLVKDITNPTSIDWKKCHDAGIDMMCVAHFNVFDEWFSMPTDPNPDSLAHTFHMMNLLEEKLLTKEIKPYAKIIRNRYELQDHLQKTELSKAQSYQIAAVHCLEGGHAMGLKLGAVEELAERGVAMIEITHFFQKGIGSAANSFPFFPDQDALPPSLGLTKEGKDIIREMNKCGIIVDISHSTSTAIQDVLDTTRSPIIASHVSSRTLADHPYSITDEHARRIAGEGGIVGVICEPWWESNFATNHDAEKKGSIDDIIRTVEYFLKICGNNNVGMGSDFAGYITEPSDWDELGNIERLRCKMIEEFGAEVTQKTMATNVIKFFCEYWGKPA